eukprot:jgi/Picsp_1/4110/NSC_01620-R1_---NA---
MDVWFQSYEPTVDVRDICQTFDRKRKKKTFHRKLPTFQDNSQVSKHSSPNSKRRSPRPRSPETEKRSKRVFSDSHISYVDLQHETMRSSSMSAHSHYSGISHMAIARVPSSKDCPRVPTMTSQGLSRMSAVVPDAFWNSKEMIELTQNVTASFRLVDSHSGEEDLRSPFQVDEEHAD